MDPHQQPWTGPRLGSRRLQEEPAGGRMQSKARSVPMPAAGTPSANNPVPKFTPHSLQLKPGAEVAGKPLLTSSNANSNSITGSTGGTPDSCDSRSYQLESELHRGPRSAVWRAFNSATKQPVVLKVLGLGFKQQQTAALQELVIMQQISRASKASAADMQQPQHPQHANTTASTAAGEMSPTAGNTSSISMAASPGGMAVNSSSGLGKHLVYLLDAFLAQQQQSQHVSKQHPRQNAREAIKPEAAAPRGAGALAPALQQQPQQLQIDEAAIKDAVDDASSASVVVLVLPQLHQSLSWVLHFVNQRKGRMGLPPDAVRSFSHQLLSALAELHDQQAVVHRDVKPSNLLLQQPFVVRTGKKHLMRSMTLQELTAAQWMLVDLGSAGQLQPPADTPAAAATHTSPGLNGQLTSPAHQLPNSQSAALQPGLQHNPGFMPWLFQLWDKLQDRTLGQHRSSRTAATPSGQQWQVAAGDVPQYETAAYTPPEAILHCPATAAYDVWSAACSIYEAATGRPLFPVEEAAAARRSLANRVYRSSAQGGDESSEDDVSTMLDEVHLALLKGVAGPAPPQLLAHSSVAQELFACTDSGRLWISEEEEDVPELRHWRERFSKPLLHQLMAKRTMTLQQAVDLAGLLQPMLSWDPADRPTAAELLQHPYFKPLHVSQVPRS